MLRTAAAVFLLSTVACYAADDCADQFAGGVRPSSNAENTVALCYGKFALLYSGKTKTPVWAAEHLTAERVALANAHPRPDPGPFHTDDQVPEALRADLTDYHSASKIYDRGHMAPRGDMPDDDSTYNSFSLANMVPQHACDNELIWERIESATRTLATESGELFTVTGPIYDNATPKVIGKHNVAVPTRIFKAIYVPSTGKAAVYVTANSEDQSWTQISAAELQRVTGVDAFPALSADAKVTPFDLPEPPPALYSCRLSNAGADQ